MLRLVVSSPIVALGAIGKDLDAGFGELQWILSACALMLAVVVLPRGSLADRYGRRRVLLIGPA